MLADFARTGGIAVANAIMADFARRAAEEFAKDDSPSPPAAAEPTPRAIPSGPEEPKAAATPAAPPPLAAHGLVWVVIKAYLARLGRWLGIGR